MITAIQFHLCFAAFLLFLLGIGQCFNRVYWNEAPQEVRINAQRKRRKRRIAINKMKTAAIRWLHP